MKNLVCNGFVKVFYNKTMEKPPFLTIHARIFNCDLLRYLLGSAMAGMPKRLWISLANVSAWPTRKLSVITSSGFDRRTYSISPLKSEWSLRATMYSLSAFCRLGWLNSQPLT